jgi:hypothetical protein
MHNSRLMSRFSVPLQPSLVLASYKTNRGKNIFSGFDWFSFFRANPMSKTRKKFPVSQGSGVVSMLPSSPPPPPQLAIDPYPYLLVSRTFSR